MEPENTSLVAISPDKHTRIKIQTRQNSTSSTVKTGSIIGVCTATIIGYFAYKKGVFKRKPGGKKSDGSAASVAEEDDFEEEEEKVPAPTPDLPEHVQYLLIGAGTASHGAMRSIRINDPKSKVLIIGSEDFMPYMRPPLSKELWFTEKRELVENFKFENWTGKEISIFYTPEAFYAEPKDLPTLEDGGVALLTGHRVVKLEPEKKIAHLDNGSQITFDKCLIATGGKPRNLSILEKAPKEVKRRTMLFRTIKDFQKLDSVLQSSNSVAIIGGGFLGSELACALGRKSKSTGLKVFQIFPEKGNMAKVFPEYLSKWTTEKIESEGVNVISERHLKSVSFKDKQVQLKLDNGDEAGDAACFYDILLGRRRVEHHDHAVVSGKLAGKNMTGADLGPNIGYEAIGIVDSTLETVAVFAKATEEDTPKAATGKTGEGLRSDSEKGTSDSVPKTPAQPPKLTENTENINVPKSAEDYGKGIVFYLKDKVIVGIMLWNVFGKMPIARKVLRDGAENEDLYEVAKNFFSENKE
ncbi:hypothetical protein KUTeg_024851 [Tegillarca granosa]|uniref:Apoptosis-inducing factor 1, mitochondrial n=1 Tax=Tegillarca granosa TaxID=220873 RepID=A0ABQ9E460_TEGGR|nr:hypothetical protein KUTeg_024851 [Tegillarca granosa]